MTEQDLEIQNLLRENRRLKIRVEELEGIVSTQQAQIDSQRNTIDFLRGVEKWS